MSWRLDGSVEIAQKTITVSRLVRNCLVVAVTQKRRQIGIGPSFTAGARLSVRSLIDPTLELSTRVLIDRLHI